LVTNGTLLNHELIQFFNQYNCNLTISFDGPEYIQNNQRPLISNENSYFSVINNLINVNKNNIHIRATYYNLNISLKDIYKHIYNLGFEDIDIAPDFIHFNKNDFIKLNIYMDDLKDILIKHIILHKKIYMSPIRNSILNLLSPYISNNYKCQAGEHIFAIDPIGNIYPCHRFCGDDNHILGNIFSENKLLPFNSKINKDKCKNCWNKFTCTHGCIYNNYIKNGTYNYENELFCLYSKKLTEISIEIIDKISFEILNQILNF